MSLEWIELVILLYPRSKFVEIGPRASHIGLTATGLASFVSRRLCPLVVPGVDFVHGL